MHLFGLGWRQGNHKTVDGQGFHEGQGQEPRAWLGIRGPLIREILNPENPKTPKLRHSLALALQADTN